MITATISHDMRTPLNAIIGMGRILEKYVRSDDQGKRTHRIIVNSANLLLYLVNDMLDLFKIKNGKFTKLQMECNVRSEIETLLEIF